MNKKIVLALFALQLSSSAWTQTIEGKNMTKINLSAFVAKGLGIQYERQVGRRITVGLGYNNIPKSNIAFKSLIEKQIDDPDVKLGDFKLGTSIFTPDVRYYFGKQGAFHGFYLAPYARFSRYNIEGPVAYTTSTGARKDLVFTGSLNATTGGLMLGSSFNLHKKLYLDWWILGASIGGANGTFIGQTQLNNIERDNLQKELDNIEVPFTTTKAVVTNNGATISTTGSMVGIRGLGINLGIRF